MNWQGLVGHEGQKRGMERILKKGRLGQAYLFTGPSGVGKKRFAKTLCASLLCLKQGRTPELGLVGIVNPVLSAKGIPIPTFLPCQSLKKKVNSLSN